MASVGAPGVTPPHQKAGLPRGVTLTGGRPRLCYFESPDHIHALETWRASRMTTDNDVQWDVVKWASEAR